MARRKKYISLFVCEYCLQAIESRGEGGYYKRVDDWDVPELFDGDGVAVCQWCEEETEELYELKTETF